MKVWTAKEEAVDRGGVCEGQSSVSKGGKGSTNENVFLVY